MSWIPSPEWYCYNKQTDRYFKQPADPNKIKWLNSYKATINKTIKAFDDIFKFDQKINFVLTYADGQPVTLNKIGLSPTIALSPSIVTKPIILSYQLSHELLHLNIRNEYDANYALNYLQEILACLSSLLCLQKLYPKEWEEYIHNITIFKKINSYIAKSNKELVKLLVLDNAKSYCLYTAFAYKLMPFVKKSENYLFLLSTAELMNKKIDNLSLFFSEWYQAENKAPVIKEIAKVFNIIL